MEWMNVSIRESKWAKEKFPLYVLLSELLQKMLSTFRVGLPVWNCIIKKIPHGSAQHFVFTWLKIQSSWEWRLKFNALIYALFLWLYIHHHKLREDQFMYKFIVIFFPLVWFQNKNAFIQKSVFYKLCQHIFNKFEYIKEKKRNKK